VVPSGGFSLLSSVGPLRARQQRPRAQQGQERTTRIGRFGRTAPFVGRPPRAFAAFLSFPSRPAALGHASTDRQNRTAQNRTAQH
jgi:hypothetical protein